MLRFSPSKQQLPEFGAQNLLRRGQTRSSQLIKVTAEGATIRTSKGEEIFVATDMVVISAPRKANHDLFNEFQWMVDELHGAGDAVIPRGLEAAIHEGYRMGVRI